VDDDRSSQRWLGKLIGVIVGAFLLRGQPVLGALIGLLIGHAVDAGWFGTRRDDPYRIFGLTDEASDAEIDLARRRLLARHHPDRATGASRRQAERAASEINAAYDRIRKLRGRH
jgi:preprotein translocase subunit Sec63